MANGWQGALRGARVFISQGINERWKEISSADEIAEYGVRSIEELGCEYVHWLATGAKLG